MRRIFASLDQTKNLFGLVLVTICLGSALALLPLPYAAVLVGASAVLVLALIDPVWALYLAVLSVPVQEIVQLPGGLSVTQAALLLAVGAWGLRILAYPERPVYFGRIALGLAVLLWALALATATTPYSQNEALKETLRWTTVALIYLLALNSITATSATDNWRWRAVGLVICLLFAPAANALFGLWQFITASGPPSFAVAGGRFVRAYGTIGQPNSFAGYLNMAWPLAVALVLSAVLAYWAQRPRQRWSWSLLLPGSLFAGFAALLLLGLVASFSRGGWVGAAGGVLGLIVGLVATLDPTLRQRAWHWGGIALVGGLALLLLGGEGLLPDIIAQRLASITRNLRLFDVRTVMVTPENFAVVERMAHLQAAWAMWLQYPLTGVGPGNFSLAFEGSNGLAPLTLHPWYGSRGHAHNYYLHIAAEAGTIGLVAYLSLLATLVLQARVTLRRVSGWFWRGIAIGGCGIITSVAAHNIFENLHVLNMGIQMAALWGLLAALERNAPFQQAATLDSSAFNATALLEAGPGVHALQRTAQNSLDMTP